MGIARCLTSYVNVETSVAQARVGNSEQSFVKFKLNIRHALAEANNYLRQECYCDPCRDSDR